MKTRFIKGTIKSLFTLLTFLILVQWNVSCQNNQNPRQKTQNLTPEQTATIKNILSKYNASTLSAADARVIHEKFRASGIHAGPETRDAIISAGFDPDKLKALDPPPDKNDQGRPGPPSAEERLKTAETDIIKPLNLNASQNETVINAFKEFYTGMENLMKTQENPGVPIEKSKIEPLETKRDEKIKQVLSADQFKKYQELERASRPHRPDDNGPGQK
jgi:Spy/CpxP family protein refolding chaperone